MSGFCAVPRSTGWSGVSARARCAATASASISPRRSSSPRIAILETSCEVRKPSKKCRNGMRVSRVAACAMAARSCASWTDPDASSATPGLAACHDVGVVAEDRERMGRDCARRDVQTAGGQLARDLVEIRDHQQQALRGREGRGEGARLEGAVDRAGGAALRLHLHDHRDASPDVRPSRRRPLVGELAHRRARRDRVDGDDLAQAMRHRGDRLVAVESLQAGGGGHGSHSSVGAGRHI